MSKLKVYQIDAIVSAVQQEIKKQQAPVKDKLVELEKDFEKGKEEIFKKLDQLLGQFIQENSTNPLLKFKFDPKPFNISSFREIGVFRSDEYYEKERELDKQIPQPQFTESEIRSKIILSDLKMESLDNLIQELSQMK